MFKKPILIFLIVAILVSFGLGILYGRSNVICSVCPPQDVDFSLVWEAWKMVHEKFVEPEKLNTQEMIYGAISGILKAIKDPYTVFLNPSQSKNFVEDISGRFEGVGMEIGIRNDELQVISPLEGTPAQKAGLRAGDKILQIDGTSTADLSVEEAVSIIRGPKGTEVKLTIFRTGWDKPKDITLKRDLIEIPSLKWELKDNDIVYIQIYQFSQKAQEDFNKAAIEILNSPGKKIILDLRNNPGGYLEVAQNIAGWFLKKDQIVTIEDFGGKQKNEEFKSNGNGQFSGYKIVILINNGSASASEILAGALRDNLGITLIGDRSFGKGTVQELFALKDGSELKITTGKWLTPKGQSIENIGIEPDIKVEITDKDYEEGKDPQLDKAIEVIKNL